MMKKSNNNKNKPKKGHWQCHPLSIYRHKLQEHISQLHPKIQSHTKWLCSAKPTDWSLIFTTDYFSIKWNIPGLHHFFSSLKKKKIRHMLEHVNVFCSNEAVNQDYPSFHGVMSNSPDVDVFNVSNVPMRTSCRENKAKMLKAECTLLLNRISPKSL